MSPAADHTLGKFFPVSRERAKLYSPPFMPPSLVLSSSAVHEAAAVLDALRGGKDAQTFTLARVGADECGDLRIESERLTLHPRSREVEQLTRIVAEHGRRRSA